MEGLCIDLLLDATIKGKQIGKMAKNGYHIQFMYCMEGIAHFQKHYKNPLFDRVLSKCGWNLVKFIKLKMEVNSNMIKPLLWNKKCLCTNGDIVLESTWKTHCLLEVSQNVNIVEFLKLLEVDMERRRRVHSFQFGVDPESSSYLLLGDTFRCARARKVISGGLSFFWRRTFRVSIQRCQFNEIRHNPLLFCYLLFSAKKARAVELLLSDACFCLPLGVLFFPVHWVWKVEMSRCSFFIHDFHRHMLDFFCFALGSTALASNAVNYF